MVKIGVCGYSGRIGSKIVEYLTKTIVSQNKYFFAGGFNSQNSLNDFDKLFQDSDIIIDFSTPKMLSFLLDRAVIYHRDLMIGTTGFSDSQFYEIQESAKKIKIFYSSNVSIVLDLLSHFLCKSKFLLDNFDFHITDIHHKNKKDAPSGTSNSLKNTIETTSASTNISQSSIRLADLLAEHRILLVNQNESLEITHRTLNLELTVKNIFFIVEWFLLKKAKGLYRMKDFTTDNFNT